MIKNVVLLCARVNNVQRLTIMYRKQAASPPLWHRLTTQPTLFMVLRAKCVVSELCVKKLGVYDVKLKNLSFAAVPYK